jgi:hypothetical protein
VKIIPQRLGCAFGQDNSHDSHIQVKEELRHLHADNAIKASKSDTRTHRKRFCNSYGDLKRLLLQSTRSSSNAPMERIMDVKSHQQFKASRVDCASQGTGVHGRARKMERRDWGVVSIVQSSEMHASRV